MRRLILLLALPIWACAKPAPPAGKNDNLVAAASPDPAPPLTPPAPAAATPGPATGPRPPASTAVGARPPAPTAATAKLAVDGEGLRLVDPVSGRTTPLVFGMDEAQLLKLLDRLRGPAARGINGECGAGPLGTANWADGLSLLMKSGKFVGWAVDGRSHGAITNMAGIGTGSSRAQLADAMSARFTKTSLGTEFQAGAIGGLLDGPGAAAKITNLWAGTTCLFR